MYPAIIAVAVSLLTLSLAGNGFAVLLSGALLGLGYGTVQSSVLAIAVKVSTKEQMGLATSTSFIFLDLGMGIGPFILGDFIQAMGYRGLYAMMSGVAIACVLIYWLLHGRKARTKPFGAAGIL